MRLQCLSDQQNLRHINVKDRKQHLSFIEGAAYIKQSPWQISARGRRHPWKPFPQVNTVSSALVLQSGKKTHTSCDLSEFTCIMLIKQMGSFVHKGSLDGCKKHANNGRTDMIWKGFQSHQCSPVKKREENNKIFVSKSRGTSGLNQGELKVNSL